MKTMSERPRSRMTERINRRALESGSSDPCSRPLPDVTREPRPLDADRSLQTCQPHEPQTGVERKKRGIDHRQIAAAIAGADMERARGTNIRRAHAIDA